MSKTPAKVRRFISKKEKEAHLKNNKRAKKKHSPKPVKLTPIQKRGKKFAHELARKATPAERRFKTKLLAFNFNTCFQKPFSDGGTLYIADFYIPLFALIIELDGGYHCSQHQQEYDSNRDNWFSKKGYNVWRLKNEEADAIAPDEILKKLGTYKRISK